MNLRKGRHSTCPSHMPMFPPAGNRALTMCALLKVLVPGTSGSIECGNPVQGALSIMAQLLPNPAVVVTVAQATNTRADGTTRYDLPLSTIGSEVSFRLMFVLNS